MAQETTFFVKANNNTLIEAKVLTDNSGTPIKNPNFGIPFPTSKGAPVAWGAPNLTLYDADGQPLLDQSNLQFYIVPANFNLQNYTNAAVASSFDAPSVASFWLGAGNFQVVHPGAVGKNDFTLLFTDANSFVLGLTASTNPDSHLIGEAGVFNRIKGGADTGGDFFGNPTRNVNSQNDGLTASSRYNLTGSLGEETKHEFDSFLGITVTVQ